jgi:hypothetical protein
MDMNKYKKIKNFMSMCMSFVLLLALVSCSGYFYPSNNSQNKEKETVTTEENTEKSETNLQFYLNAGEKGEYGELLTYNKGTEFEETFYAYYVPTGTYVVTNVGSYMTQVNVYSNKTQFTDEGWEEPADCIVFLLKVGESKEVTVPKDYHVDITGPTRILMSKLNETD